MNLFLELRRHGKLADKRHPMYDKNKFGRFWMYLMAAFWAGYLIFFGTTFAFALSDESREPYQIINGVLIIILALDFLIRFPFQKTPTQEMKPYLLLPIRRKRLIDCLLLRSGLSTFNLFWLFFFVPLAIISVARYYGVAGVVTYSIGIWLLMVMNNYWFLLCRTLMNERVWWAFLPVAVYAAIGCALFIPDDSLLLDGAITLGEGFITGHPLCFLGVIVAIALLWLVNRKVMQGLVYNELNKVEDTTVKVRSVSEYRFLDRYGEIGEYMRLELKMLLRNKVCKASLRSIIIVVVAFSLILSFTEAYDSAGMKSFIMVYNYVIFGIMFLLSIMSYEGNYIDGLMSRKESIYSLLRAKYILYSIAILIPFLLMIPAMVTGKLTVLSCLSWAIFTAGAIYFCLFQLAVYNNHTLDLNTRLTNRKNMGTGLQNLISFAAFGLPLLLNFILNLWLGETTTGIVLIIIGLGFILTSRFWLKNIYHRFMKRRYKNLEGFRDSRQK